MGKKEKKKKILIILLFLLIIVFGILLFSRLIDYLSVLEKHKLYAEVIVSDHIGIDINGTALKFGMTVPGGSLSKEIFIGDNNQEVYVKVYVTGEIKRFMEVSDNNFLLRKGENKTLEFLIYIPEGTDLGTYNGEVTIIIKNPIVK